MSQPGAADRARTATELQCFHCGLLVPAGLDLHVTVQGSPQPMCCHGCEAVARTIVDYGLEDYYRHRSAPAPNATDTLLIPEELRVFDDERMQAGFVTATDDGSREANLLLDGITCPACLWLNERHLGQLEGINAVQINYTTHRARVRWNPEIINLSRILTAVSEIGYRAHPYDAEREEELLQKERKQQLRRLGLAGLLGMQVMMIGIAFYTDVGVSMEQGLRNFLSWISLGLTIPVVAYSAAPFFTRAWGYLRNWTVGMDVPVALAIGLGFAASAHATVTGTGEIYYDTITMFVFLLLLGRFFEFSMRKRAIERASRLNPVLPATARRFPAEGNGSPVLVPVLELQPGDRVLVLPGETVPIDGLIREGSSSLDESLLTGEFMPHQRTAGELVIGGSVNVESPLQVEVTRVGEDTLQSRIHRLVERAQADKPGITRTADIVAGWFVLGVLIAAGLTAWAWLQIDPSRWLPVTVAVLVVSCPCALSLATPTALTAALSSFMHRGLAVTRGTAVERLAKITHVIFDKTGTLTTGQPVLRRIQPLASMNPRHCLRIAAALEQHSEHPIARALLAAVPDTPLPHVTNASNRPGAGISGCIDGKDYYIGKPEFILTQTGLNARLPLSALSETETESVILLADSQRLLAAFIIADSVRPGAVDAIRKIQNNGRETVLLSGDQPQVAHSVGAALGIGTIEAGLDPAGKLARINALQSEGARVAMVGDGINDAPVLAKANASIAMGSGAELARNQADIILIGDNLMRVSQAFSMADRTSRIIRQNLAWAAGYNIVALPITMAGYVTPWMACLGMTLSSLLVLANSSRLSRYSDK